MQDCSRVVYLLELIVKKKIIINKTTMSRILLFFVIIITAQSCKNERIDTPSISLSASNDSLAELGNKVIANDTNLIANPINKDDASTEKLVTSLLEKRLAINTQSTLKCYITNVKSENGEFNLFVDSLTKKIIKVVAIENHPSLVRKKNFYQYYFEDGLLFGAIYSGAEMPNYEMFFDDNKMIRWYGKAHKSITKDLQEYKDMETKVLSDFNKNKALLSEYSL